MVPVKFATMPRKKKSTQDSQSNSKSGGSNARCSIAACSIHGGGLEKLSKESQQSILVLLSAQSLRNLALTSKFWLKYLHEWLLSGPAVGKLAEDLKQLDPPSWRKLPLFSGAGTSGNPAPASWKIVSPAYIKLHAEIGDLVRAVTMFLPIAKMSKYVVKFEKKLKEACESKVEGFLTPAQVKGVYYASCLKSCSEAHLRSAIAAIVRASQMKRKLTAYLDNKTGLMLESHIKLLSRMFPDDKNLLIAVETLSKEQELTPKHTAELLYVLRGPFEENAVIWNDATPEEHQDLGKFLSYCSLNSSVLDVEKITEALFETPEQWSLECISFFLRQFDENAVITYKLWKKYALCLPATKKGGGSPFDPEWTNVIIDLAFAQNNMALRLLSELRSDLSDGVFKKLVLAIFSDLDRRIAINAYRGIVIFGFQGESTERCLEVKTAVSNATGIVYTEENQE